MTAAIFAKTAAGMQEVELRSGKLSPRVRRVLILVDGRRSVDDLRELVQADDLTHTLGLLEEAGLIELAQAPAAPRAITAFRDDGADGDPLRLQKARNFMVNTLQAFVGTVTASALIERIEAAGTLAALRAQYDEWYHAIVMSRDGRRQAEALRASLLDTI